VGRSLPCRTGKRRVKIASGPYLPDPFAEKSFCCKGLDVSRQAAAPRPAGKMLPCQRSRQGNTRLGQLRRLD
jgi:hypothetical protein